MKIFQKDSLPVIGATVVASLMILVTGNGVADAVKLSEQPTQKMAPPPGPFDFLSAKNGEVAKKEAGIKPSVPVAPKEPLSQQGVDGSNSQIEPPTMPEMAGTPPPELEALIKPMQAKAVAKPDMAKDGPEFKRAMPSINQAPGAIKSPAKLAANLAPPVMPEAKVVMPKVTASPKQLAVAPKLSKDIPPLAVDLQAKKVGQMPPQLQYPVPQSFQRRMPAFGVNGMGMPVPPQMQLYRYVPVPVFQQSIPNYPVAPTYRGYMPAPNGYWVPNNGQQRR